MASAFQTLRERGYVYQLTDEDEIRALIDSEASMTFYLGIDPTADSLHIGHFFALMMFRYLQDAGHRGILVIGGATAMVGDPSGKSDMRKMLTREEVERNFGEVKKLASRFIRTEEPNSAIIINNNDWISGYDYVSFLRDVGVHFNINTMLAADSYAKRLEEGGLTFLEMGYMLMQAYDFVHLNQKYSCVLQIGGSDQWGNIVAGVGLHRKLGGKKDGSIFGLTCPLLTTKEGKKMGKTESGTLWVAREKTTVFDFYQYFYNVKDEDVETLLKLFTRLPMEEISTLLSTDIVLAKRTMAFEITKLVHGEAEAASVLNATADLFSSDSQGGQGPTASVDRKYFDSGALLTSVLAEVGFISSRSEARRLIEQGGLSLNGERVRDTDRVLSSNDLRDGKLLVKKGKKGFLTILVSDPVVNGIADST